ncbi:MAG TPA: hypothetical protein VGR62_00180 [Candidatus Binatia bacterium]|nr:hypothetical protein [Candidatus Binatia bacterium]
MERIVWAALLLAYLWSLRPLFRVGWRTLDGQHAQIARPETTILIAPAASRQPGRKVGWS